MSLDLDLFVKQAAWLGPMLRDPSRIGVLTWLGQRFDGNCRRSLLRHFPLMHPVQKQAEDALCALLSRAIVVQPFRLRSVSAAVRSVDWTATYTRGSGRERPPLPYLARIRDAIPDRSCLSALATLSYSWSKALSLIADSDLCDRNARLDSELRVRRLARAVPPQLARGLTPVAFDRRHALRLRSLDSTAAAQVDCLTEALGFWHGLFGGHAASDADALVRLVRTLQEDAAENIDTMMEATVALSIARAATQAERPDWPTAGPWTLESVDDPISKYPVIRLKSGELLCEIAKGTPREIAPDGSKRRVTDLLIDWANDALPTTGKSRSTGRQPDVVLTFWLASRPAHIEFVLADAKRNAEGNGEEYLRDALEVAATYLMSFGYRMGLMLPSPAGGRITTTLTPGVTLFCRQGAGVTESKAIEVLRADHQAPVVMAFDLEKHFSPTIDPWHAPVLAAWIGSLGRQAFKVLSEANTGRRKVRARAH
jgi:hypothetical protein